MRKILVKKNNSEEGLLNCIRLTNPITDIFTRRYAYLDSEDYLADQIFERRNLKVKFYKEEFHKDSWVIVRCKIRRKDESEFLQAMKELSNNITLCNDGKEYAKICDEFKSAFQKILSGNVGKIEENPS